MRSKKILYISQVFPYPADGGGKIKTLNSLRALAKEYEIYAIFISEKKPSEDEINYLKKLGVKTVKVFYNPGILASVKDDYLHLFKNFLKFRPHYVFQYTHEPAFSFIKNAIKKNMPDIIHIDHINIAQYLPKEKKQTWILEHHNLEFYLLWTRFIHSSKWSRKLYLLIESSLTYLFEKKMIKKFDHVFTISKPEAIRVKKFFGVKSVSAQPLVYPKNKIVANFRSKKNESETKKNSKKTSDKSLKILFIGSLGWPPNEDAVEWFVNKMFPKVLDEFPNAELHVVGKNNPELIKRLPKNKQIILHGFQKNLNKFLKEATVFILPFRMGGGVRIKGLTALAAGIPIISTGLGIEGLGVKNNSHYFLANSEAEFATKTIKLLKSKKIREKMSNNQLKYIKKYHSKKENLKWLKKYSEVANQKSLSFSS